ncbi:MAG: hypothetical protein LBU82_06470 [Treponema sp.]|jgi:hypothetical protein|nr:hypothetical protein [Treponema sp.]
MTKRDKATFDKAFKAMEEDGSLDKLRAKLKAKSNPTAHNPGIKPRRNQEISASGRNSSGSIPLIASKK